MNEPTFVVVLDYTFEGIAVKSVKFQLLLYRPLYKCGASDMGENLTRY